MDYNLTYNSFYNENYRKFEKIIKHRLIISKKKKLNFGPVLVDIRTYLSINYPKKIRLLQDSRLDNLYKIFNTRYSLFEKDHIEEIFKKIEKEFNKLSIDYNYTITDLIREIALLEVANEIGRLLHNRSSFFEMFYKADNLEEFEIKEYGNVALENVPIYKKLHRTLYPEYYNNSSSTHVTNKSIVFLKNDNIEEWNEIKNNLGTNEKSFLFYIMCKALSEPNNGKGEYNLPNTELLRLNTIIDFKDEKSFTKNYGDSVHYKILAKGLEHIPSNEQTIFLSNLINNLTNLQLKETTKYIKQILETHLNKLVRKKK